MATGGRAAVLVAILVLAALPLAFLPPRAEGAGQVQLYLGGLNVPIALGFSPDARIFYAERNTGAIRIIVNRSVLPTPFYTLPNTNSAGERGLLGLALDPGFPTVPYVYAYQTFNNLTAGTIYNRIVKILADGDVGVSDTVILRLPPLSGATNHNGGVIAFGPDRKLYAVVGENANIALSQNPMSPMGKVLRMETDGRPPTDNPFYGSLSADNLIFTYGHRNMFGLAFHPFTNRVYVTENGPNCNDEVNLLVRGGNFGWGNSETCNFPPALPDINTTNRDGATPILPIWWWANTICPTNAAIYGGPYFPRWQGDLFMGDCNFARFHRLHLVGPAYDTVASDTILWTAPGFIMDVEAGPDGAIWITTQNAIYRYWDSSQPPVPQFVASPPSTMPGITVSFDGSSSSDPDGNITSYAWDFGDGQFGAGVTTSHVYGAVGTYNVTLTVVDNETYSRSVSHPEYIFIPPVPPHADFTANPTLVNPGVPVTFNASPSYDLDGTIVAYDWDFGDTTTGSGVAIQHAFALPVTYTITLTVTDNSSRTDTTSRTIRVNAPPVAAFTATPSQSYIGVAIAFDAGGSTDDGTITLYAWNFGDLRTGVGRTAAHQYTAKGPFVVTLTVRDNLGLTDRTTHTIAIVNRPPQITSVVPPTDELNTTAGQVAPLEVTAVDPDDDTLTYTWTVDDVAAGGNLPSFNFTGSPGTYRVNVTVSDGTAQVRQTWTITVRAAADSRAWAIPVGLAILVVVLLFLWFFVWRRRKPRDAPPP